PIGSFLGNLSTIPATELAATAAKAALEDAKVAPEAIEEVMVGCVLPAGLGQAPARQVSVFSGVPKSARALTVNKVCGSGLKAVLAAADSVALQRSEILLAGGMENMSLSPYYLNGRQGFRMGNQEVVDGMIHDGLWDVYNRFHMGMAGELCAKKYHFTREA